MLPYKRGQKLRVQMPMVKAEKRYSQQKHLRHGGHGFPINK
jgi:ribosome recycling factor